MNEVGGGIDDFRLSGLTALVKIDDSRRQVARHNCAVRCNVVPTRQPSPPKPRPTQT